MAAIKQPSDPKYSTIPGQAVRLGEGSSESWAIMAKITAPTVSQGKAFFAVLG
jgi:hypothetical protein